MRNSRKESAHDAFLFFGPTTCCSIDVREESNNRRCTVRPVDRITSLLPRYISNNSNVRAVYVTNKYFNLSKI